MSLGHLVITDKMLGPKGVHYRGVPLYSKHSNTHARLSNIRTPTPCGARTGVIEHLLAFDNLCGARVRVTEHILEYYSRFQMSTRLLLSLQSSNGGCQMCTSSLCGAWMGVAKCVLAFNSLCRAQMGVAKCIWQSQWRFPSILRQSLRSLNGG